MSIREANKEQVAKLASQGDHYAERNNGQLKLLSKRGKCVACNSHRDQDRYIHLNKGLPSIGPLLICESCVYLAMQVLGHKNPFEVREIEDRLREAKFSIRNLEAELAKAKEANQLIEQLKSLALEQ